MFNIPTFRDLLTRTQTDLGSAADGTSPRATPEYAIARALAGMSKHLFSSIQYVLRQCSPITADEVYGWRWGALFGIFQLPAQAWEGTATVTGDPSTSIPDGTEFGRADGQLYTVDGAAVTNVDGVASVRLVASEVGDDGNNDGGQILSLTAPLTGIDTDCEVQGSSQSGADVEAWEQALLRLLRRMRNPPKGGGPGDWEAWALEVPGVTRAWEFPLLEGPASVSVAFARDNDNDPIPDSGERATMLAHLQTKAPVTSKPMVITLSTLPVNLVFSTLNPNTPEVRDAIETSVSDLFTREGEPGGTIPLSRLEDAINSAVGEVSHVLSLPTTPIVVPTNRLPVLGSVTYP